MGSKKVFAKVAKFASVESVPIVKPNDNTFTTQEYAKEIGLGRVQANARLSELLAQGVLRRVKFYYSGGVRLAWEYIKRG
jgi:predicted transcriptional regulator